MAVQNINNYRRGKRQNTVIKTGVTQQRSGSAIPNVNQVLKQTSQQYQRNLQSANPANLVGAYVHTSLYGDDALADAKRRAAKGDVISQLYVNTADTLVKDAQRVLEKDAFNDNLGVRFAAHASTLLPYTIAQIPATLQAINLLQQGQTNVVKKGYQSIPGIITQTVDYAISNPVGFAGSVVAGAALGGVGTVGRVGGSGKVSKNIKGGGKKTVSDIANVGIEKGAKKGFRDATQSPPKIKTPELIVKRSEIPSSSIRVADTATKTSTQKTPATTLKRQALGQTGSVGKTSTQKTPAATLKRQALGQTRSVGKTSTQKTPAATLKRQALKQTGSAGKVSGSGTLKTQQKTVIRGNVPREFSGNIGKGYSADVKIKGNTFVLTPVDNNRITLNTQAPSTIHPVSFDDVVQNLVKGQGIAIKTGDRRARVTNTRGIVGATLEPSGARARFPDYQPNVYRPISSDDYFASAIGGKKGAGVDIYTYPFGNRQDYSPRHTPKTIKAINSDALFRLMDKTLNPAPLKQQDLNAFKNNPRVKEIELVEAGQTTKPRELPPNIQPLRITRIKEYVADYQKISFIRQKAKSIAKPAAKTKDAPSVASSGRTLTFTRQRVDAPAKIRQKSATSQKDAATPITNSFAQAYAGVLATSVALPDAKLSTIPATVIPIPVDSAYVDSLISSGDSSITAITGDVDSAITGDLSISGSVSRSADASRSVSVARSRSADASITSRVNARKQGRSPSRRGIVDTDNDDVPHIRRIRDNDVNRIVSRKRRKRKDREQDEEDEKKKKARARVKRTYRQKVNPLPWLEDAEDTSWLRKDLPFMRMPARVRVTAVRPALETYNHQVKAFNAARKKLRSTARETTAEGRKALSTLKRLYKAAAEARGRAETAVEKNRR